MIFEKLAQHRFSCRKYSNKPVEKEKLQQLIETARIAPSACNKQPWFFYIISENTELLQDIQYCYHRDWFKTAPAVIVACAIKEQAWIRGEDQKNHADIDIAIAIDHITLQATDLGLATCWICNFNVEMVMDFLHLPKNHEPIALISVGYCETEPEPSRLNKDRKPIDELSKFL